MKFPEQYRVRKGSMATNPGEPFGQFRIPPSIKRREAILIVATDGLDPDSDLPKWEHVSVSLPSRCPTWLEMCLVKDLFWEPEECVMQLHPPRSQWVNNHPHCLHLWRPLEAQIPLPPAEMVGVAGVTLEQFSVVLASYLP